MARETLEQKAMRIAQENGLDYKNVLQGMQMGDIDFQMAVAPYMGYKGEIDPSIARFHSLPEGATSRLQGFSVASDSTKPYINVGSAYGSSGDFMLLPSEAGTVNTIGAGATPSTWAHEYNHQYEKERELYKKSMSGGKGSVNAYKAFTMFGKKDAPEINARILDIRNAQNMSDVYEAVNYIAKTEIQNLEKEAEEALDSDNTRKAKYLQSEANLIRKNILIDATNESIKNYINENLNAMNVEYDKLGAFKSNLFKKIISDTENKEKQAKTAKTFKESLD